MNKFMGSAEWLEERRKGIGASDCSAVMGINPWRTPYQVYLEKRGEIKSWSGNQQAAWGLLMEPALRQFYSDATGRDVMLPNKIMYSTKHPYMLASLDGYTDDQRIVELKTARSCRGWGESGTNQIPEHYALQVHHQMIVTGFKSADVVVSIAGGSPSIYTVEADKEISEMIIEACAKFWERVQSGNPPDPVTYADAVARFGSLKAEGAIQADDSVIHAVECIKGVRSQIKELEEQEEVWKARIIIALGEKADTLIDSTGQPLITYKLANGRKMFDAKTFEKDQPNLYQKYLKTSEPSRRFLVK